MIKRYTLGLVNSVKDEAEFLAIRGELSDFAEFLEKQRGLQDALNNPFLSTTKKTQITEEILDKKRSGKKASRFILLLVENNRLEIFPDIIESMPEVWNKEKGIYTFEVASVVPLSDDQKKRLEKKLGLLDRRPVVLKYRIEPELIGGLWVRRENIVYDISIKGSLAKIREKICER